MLKNFLLQVTVGNTAVKDLAEVIVPEEKTLTVWQLVSSGGTGGAIIMLTLLILSILAVYIIVERFLVIKQASKEGENFMNQIKDNILDGKINAAKEFIQKELELNIRNDPQIFVNDQLIKNAKSKYKIDNRETNILLGIGGSGPTKRVPAKIFINFMKLATQKYNCRFFLATGKNTEEQKILFEILNTTFKDKCYALDNLSLNEILPIIKNCDISICNDSSFSHLSSGLGIDTIVLMSDTPLLYGNYNSRMYPIIPDGENTVTHDTLGKDRINPNKIFYQLNDILS